MADESTPENGSGGETDALLSRLHVIEDQPLNQRAPEYGQIHDRLQAILEGGDAPQQHA